MSVVVTVVDGGDQLRRCLDALSGQSGGPELEVIVPYDDTIANIRALEADFPNVRFLSIGAVQTVRPPTSAGGQHELFDRRRAAALAVAGGDLVAILEDRGVPRTDWARRHAELQARLPHAVIGGAIDWAGRGALSWAVYACDFSRYESASNAGPRLFVSDCNVTYKRAALERTRGLWQERYHETEVHDALRGNGEVLWFAPEAIVEEARSDLRASALVAERFAWGRLYGATRAAGATPMRRVVRCLSCAVLPFVLYSRIARRYFLRRPRMLMSATPALFLLLVFWSLGEFVGYATADA